jgi:hypothetical protein
LKKLPARRGTTDFEQLLDKRGVVLCGLGADVQLDAWSELPATPVGFFGFPSRTSPVEASVLLSSARGVSDSTARRCSPAATPDWPGASRLAPLLGAQQGLDFGARQARQTIPDLGQRRVLLDKSANQLKTRQMFIVISRGAATRAWSGGLQNAVETGRPHQSGAAAIGVLHCRSLARPSPPSLENWHSRRQGPTFSSFPRGSRQSVPQYDAARAE